MMREDFAPYRDELIISSKAGYDMWDGPYANGGSRKYLLASAEQSLARMSVDYVDIFYSHRYDPDVPVEETISALDTLVRQGKALYVGISSYSAEQTVIAAAASIAHSSRYRPPSGSPSRRIASGIATNCTDVLSLPSSDGAITSPSAAMRPRRPISTSSRPTISATSESQRSTTSPSAQSGRFNLKKIGLQSR